MTAILNIYSKWTEWDQPKRYCANVLETLTERLTDLYSSSSKRSFGSYIYVIKPQETYENRGLKDFCKRTKLLCIFLIAIKRHKPYKYAKDKSNHRATQSKSQISMYLERP